MALAKSITSRNAGQTIAALGMRCNQKEIPEAIDGGKEAGCWIAASCSFSGTVDADGTLQEVSATAPAAIAVTVTRVIGILSPNAADQPAIWWSADLAECRSAATGSQGLLKKRPASIAISFGDCRLNIADVAQLFRHSNRMQTGQEASLMQALS